MERYVELILRHHILIEGEELFTEDDIERLGCKHKKKPDFMIVKDNLAILIEVKAARRYRGAVQSAKEKELFEITTAPLVTAYDQIEEFSKYIREDKAKNFSKIETIIGIVITWEDLFIFNQEEIKKNKLPPIENCDYIHVLSLEKLESVAHRFDEKPSFSGLFCKLKDSKDPETEFGSLIGKQNASVNKENHFLVQAILDSNDSLRKK